MMQKGAKSILTVIALLLIISTGLRGQVTKVDSRDSTTEYIQDYMKSGLSCKLYVIEYTYYPVEVIVNNKEIFTEAEIEELLKLSASFSFDSHVDYHTKSVVFVYSPMNRVLSQEIGVPGLSEPLIYKLQKLFSATIYIKSVKAVGYIPEQGEKILCAHPMIFDEKQKRRLLKNK